MYCDLHTHSIFSDGTNTPEELIEMAEGLHLSAIALTDHNSVSGLPRFLAAAEGKALRAVPGVEFTTNYEALELHVLALFVREQHYSAVTDLVALPDRRKRESNLALAEALNRAGYAIDYAAMEAATPDGRVNRSQFADELIRLGYFSDKQMLFDTVLKPGGGFYLPPERLDVFDTLRFIRSIGAVAVLAHPFLQFHSEEALRRFLPRGIEAGLDGMEVYYSTYSPETTALALRLAREYGLALSGGSDYHGTRKPHIQLAVGKGGLAIGEDVFSDLAALARARQG